jgi:hypothetical protein
MQIDKNPKLSSSGYDKPKEREGSGVTMICKISSS